MCIGLFVSFVVFMILNGIQLLFLQQGINADFLDFLILNVMMLYLY